MIENFDGRSIPESEFLTDITDLSRTFPWDWAPEPAQTGAGRYPGSEPESRAVQEWTSRHPELYAWLNLHTCGGVFIRPLEHDRAVPTWGLDSSRGRPWNTPVYAEIETKGCELVDGSGARREVGHLAAGGAASGSTSMPLYICAPAAATTGGP